MTRKDYTETAKNYLEDILTQAEMGKIEYLEKEKKGDVVEITTTYGGPTAWLVVQDEKVTFYFSYSPFEYSERITNIELINKIKQAI